MMKHLAAAALIALGMLSTRRAQAQEMGIAVGAEAPSAAVQMLDGQKVDLSKYYGTMPVVIEFWATWCPLCKKLEPSLQAARVKYAGKVMFVGVGVSNNQSAERQAEFVKKQQMSGDYVFDMDNNAQKAFAAPHTSYVVVIDRNRKVVYTGVGPQQDIDAAVQKAMSGG